MTARFAIMFLLAFSLPSVPAQGQARDTARVSPTVKDLPLTAAQRQSYAGSYSATLPYGKQVSVRVFEERGVLKVRASDHPDEARRLLYQGDNAFLVENAPDFVVTFAMEAGRVTGFNMRRADGVAVAVRNP